MAMRVFLFLGLFIPINGNMTTADAGNTTTDSTTTPKPDQRVTRLDRYKFESVDIEEVPQNFRDWNEDCHGQYMLCVRDTPFVWVCAFNVYTWRFAQIPNECLIEFLNCRNRLSRGLGIFGKNPHGDVLYYNGEGHNCAMYTRRARSYAEMVEIYFQGDASMRQYIQGNMPKELNYQQPTFINWRTNMMDGNNVPYHNYLQDPRSRRALNIQKRASSN